MMMKGAFRFINAILLCHYASSADFLVGYLAQTRVADHAAIDMDQEKIDLMLALGRLENVKKIYEQGGNSQSIARLNIIGKSQTLNETIPSGTEVIGKSTSGSQVYGTLLLGFGENDDEVLVQYPPKTMESTRNCQVGGLASMDMEMTDGCFAEKGELTILDSDVKITYEYNTNFDNVNGRTIQGFSLFAEKEMASCGKNCPYEDFEKFVNYYGEYDYADKWIQAAFYQQSTSFERGNIDFSEVGTEGVKPAIQIATKFMNIWMYTIRMMESALDTCEIPCNEESCQDDAVHAWDQAVAFHAGSLQDDGILLYAFSDVMCRAFHSCGDDGSMRVGTSYANNKALEHFKLGQSYILHRECHKARAAKEEIVKAMTIPLIQATLFTAYAEEDTNDIDELSSGDLPTKKARAAAFAATVLPIVHDCSAHDAGVIYSNLGIETADDVQKKINFVAVKNAFERNYKCMGVTCEGVGGIWTDGKYADDAEPCHLHIDNKSETPGFIFGHFLATALLPIAILVSLVVFRISTNRRRLAEIEAKHTANDILDEAGLGEVPGMEKVRLDEEDAPELPPIS